MIPLTDAEIQVYDPDFDGLLTTIPQDDIISVDLSERTGRRKDDGTIVINNDDKNWEENIKSGFNLLFRVATGGPSLNPWGAYSWGDSKWGFKRTIWLARVRDINLLIDGDKENVEFDCEDYAFSALGERTITREYENTPVNCIIHEIVQSTVPHVITYVDPSLNKNTSIVFDGENGFKALEKLINRVNAEARAWKNYIAVQPDFKKDPVFAWEPGDFTVSEIIESDNQLANSVRIYGGEAVAEGKHKATDIRYYRPLSPGNREKFQVKTQKSELTNIELRLSVSRPPTDSPIRVRIQKDDNGPVNPDDRSMDIASTTMQADEIMDHYNGEQGSTLWVNFSLPNHTLPEPDPWVIVELTGNKAQRIVLDSNMKPAHIPYFPYKIIATEEDVDSQNTYGKREKRIEANHITSAAAAKELAQEKLIEYGQIDKLVQGQAKSRRMHTLRPGEVVTIDYPDKNLNGDFMVEERHGTYEAVRLNTDFTLKRI